MFSDNIFVILCLVCFFIHHYFIVIIDDSVQLRYRLYFFFVVCIVRVGIRCAARVYVCRCHVLAC
jgi:hypothetical protein